MDNTRSILRAQLMAVSPRGVVVHGAAVARGKGALLMLAPSDGGKTTAAYKLADLGWRLIGDDSVVVARGTDGVVRALPCGSHRMRTGRFGIAPAPLRGVVFLEKGPELLLPAAPDYCFYRAERAGWLMARDIVPGSVLLEARAFLRFLLRSFPVAVYRTGPGDSGEMLLAWLNSI